MLAEYFDSAVQRQRFDSVTSSGGRGGSKKRVVDRFFRSLDNGEEEWRRSVICETFDSAGRVSFVLAESFDTNVGRGREGDGVVSTAVAAGSTSPCQTHHGAGGHAVQVAGVEWRVGRDHNDN